MIRTINSQLLSLCMMSIMSNTLVQARDQYIPMIIICFRVEFAGQTQNLTFKYIITDFFLVSHQELPSGSKIGVDPWVITHGEFIFGMKHNNSKILLKDSKRVQNVC